jgi:hypothetical protein
MNSIPSLKPMNHSPLILELVICLWFTDESLAAISAEVNRGKVAGLYIDRKEVMVSKVETMSSEDLISRIQQLVDGSNMKVVNHVPDREDIISSVEEKLTEGSLAKS